MATKKGFYGRLFEAIRAWSTYSKPMRERTAHLWKHYANGWYADDFFGARTVMPLNLVDRGVQILAPFLVSKNPRLMIHPRQGLNNPNVKAFANTLELASAHLFDEIKFSEYTLRPVVIDALFGMGITKTGTSISPHKKLEIGGYLHDVGQPYCDRIDFNDYIGDTSARNRQEMKFEGHWYRMPLRYIKESGLYKNYDSLKPDVRMYGEEGSIEKIAKRQEYFELYPSVRLCDIWLAEEDTILTLPEEGQGAKPLREVKWDGPEGGPFDVLAFKYFPDSIIPIPPVYGWLDYNKVVNVMVNKMKEQVEREKTIGIGNKSASDDNEAIRNARHGEMVQVDNADSVKELTFGGFVDKSFPFLQFLLYQFSATGPNLDVAGGRRSAAGTLGQEQMLQSNAAREIDDMMETVYSFTKNICKKLMWFLWSDPFIVIPLVKRVAGIDIKVEYNDATKEGDYFDYTFDIEPYSMMKMNPEIRFQRLIQFALSIILPTAQIAAQQGTILNVPELVKELAKYLHITNLNDWYAASIPQEIGLNPYQPLQGTPAGQQTDNRFGESARRQQTGSNFNNLVTQQARAAGLTTGAPVGGAM